MIGKSLGTSEAATSMNGPSERKFGGHGKRTESEGNGDFTSTWKVPASGRPRRVFLRHNWLSRIPGWNAYEDERYKMLRRLPPRQMEKERPNHLRRAYNYVCPLSIPLRGPPRPTPMPTVNF